MRCVVDDDCKEPGALCYANATWYGEYVKENGGVAFALGQEGCFCFLKLGLTVDDEGRCAAHTGWTVVFAVFSLTVILIALRVAAGLCAATKLHFAKASKTTDTQGGRLYLKRATLCCLAVEILFGSIHVLNLVQFLLPASVYGVLPDKMKDEGSRTQLTSEIQLIVVSFLLPCGVATATNTGRIWVATAKSFKSLSLASNKDFQKKEERIHYCLLALDTASFVIALTVPFLLSVAVLLLAGILLVLPVVVYIVSRTILNVLESAKAAHSSFTRASGTAHVKERKKFNAAINAIKTTSNSIIVLVSLSVVGNVGLQVAGGIIGEKNMSTPDEPPVLQLLFFLQGLPLMLACLVGGHYLVGLNRNLFKKGKRGNTELKSRAATVNIFAKSSISSSVEGETSSSVSAGASVTPQ